MVVALQAPRWRSCMPTQYGRALSVCWSYGALLLYTVHRIARPDPHEALGCYILSSKLLINPMRMTVTMELASLCTAQSSS